MRYVICYMMYKGYLAHTYQMNHMSKDPQSRKIAIKLLEDRWIIKAIENENHKASVAAKNAHGLLVKTLKIKTGPPLP
jgi:hypothetical protein